MEAEEKRGTTTILALALSAGILAGLAVPLLSLAPTIVSGEIRGTDGVALPHVPVVAGGQTAASDEDGRYFLFPVSRTTHELRVVAWGFVPLTAQLPAGIGLFQKVDLSLQRSPRLIGRILDEDGEPLPDARVIISRVSPRSETRLAEALADEHGIFAFEALPVGEATLRAVRTGYLMGETELIFTPQTVHERVLQLQREQGRLNVRSEPAGALVSVAGSKATCTSPCELVLPSGDYHLTLTAPKHVPMELDIQVAYNQRTSLRPTLERMMGHLLVRGPVGARVLLNGRDVGPAPWEGDLPTDPYTVEVLADHRWPGRATADVRWQETATLELFPGGFSRHPNRTAWIAGLEAYLASLAGRYGVAVMDADGGAVFGTHMDDLFTAASVVKLPIALFAYHAVEASPLSLDDQWEVQPGDVTDGTGVLQYQPPGTRWTVRQLLDVLIRQSDNTAATMFRRLLGSDRIDEYMATLGAPNTRQLSVTTPRETASLLSLLWRGQVLTPEHRDELLTFLKTTAFNDRIPAGVPAGITVAHKVGMYASAVNDAGIVFAGRPYVVSVFTDTPGDWDAATRTIRTISAALYEFEL